MTGAANVTWKQLAAVLGAVLPVGGILVAVGIAWNTLDAYGEDIADHEKALDEARHLQTRGIIVDENLQNIAAQNQEALDKIGDILEDQDSVDEELDDRVRNIELLIQLLTKSGGTVGNVPPSDPQ